MKRMLRLSIVIIPTLAVLPLVNFNCLSWGEDGHRYINLVAAEKMPDDAPAFLKEAAARLSFLGPEPDRWRDSTMLNAVTGPDHFLDIDRPEEFEALPADRNQYSDWLRGQGKDPKKIGLLPYAILEGYEKVRVMFHLWRDPKRVAERRQIEENVIYYAGVLGHFVADGSQPLHATIHYNGWATSSNPDGYTREPLHGRFESDFVKANIKPDDLRGLVGRAQPLKDIFADIMKFLMASHAEVAELYTLEKKARWEAANQNAESKKFVAVRMSAGAQMLANLWYTAWLNSTAGRGGR